MSDLNVIYDLGNSSPPATLVSEMLRTSDYHHVYKSNWPCEANPLDEEHFDSDVIASESGGDSVVAVYDFKGISALAIVRVEDGSAYCSGHGPVPDAAAAAVARVEEIIGRNPQDDPKRIPMRFWAYGHHGPEFHRRELDAQGWDEIEGNYEVTTRSELARLMDDSFHPGAGGQLVLWHGVPGTGKTTAIRALAQEWREWASFDYVTDPDKFFGEKADYMLRVMLGEKDDRWHVLILEDAGELIQPDAKQSQGQALSRFLNAVDGLIGQGLRVMVILTTNEDFSSGHEAVTRHGRAAAQIEFRTFGPEEAREWLAREGVTTGAIQMGNTLADLYAIREDRQHRPEEKRVGFTG